MTSRAATISEYLEELPPDRRAALSELRTLIHRVAPKTVEAMKYGLPSFGELCALASQKNYMALCVCESDLVKTHLGWTGSLQVIVPTINSPSANKVSRGLHPPNSEERPSTRR